MRPPGPGPGQPSVPAGFSLVQVQGDRLLGDRGAQPPDLLRAAASSAASAVMPGLPGTEADSASRAPRLATWQMCVTVDRSTFHFSAASRCVACPVSTDTKISYFSDGASRRRDLDEGLRVTEFTLRSDTVISLQTGVTRRLVAGYFLPLLSHEVRRKARLAVAAGSQEAGAAGAGAGGGGR